MRVLCAAVLLCAGGICRGADDPAFALKINEIMAWNRNYLFPGPPGSSTLQTPDLVEIYNPTNDVVLLYNLYLTDGDPAAAATNFWRFPPGAWIAGRGYYTVLCDGAVVTGEARASFRLEEKGEAVYLLARDKLTVIDAITFGCQTPNVSLARLPDGGDTLAKTASPTFCWGGACTCDGYDADGDGAPDRQWCAANERANIADDIYPPEVDIESYAPLMPAADAPVTVTARVACADTPADKIELWFRYQGDAEPQPAILMQDDGAHGDGAAGDGLWAGTIPAQGERGVEFRVIAYRGAAVDIEPDTQWIAYMSGRTAVPPLVITEILPKNLANLANSNGDFGDWVELYNASTADIALDGYYLTDNYRRPHKWAFPLGLVLGAGARRLVWCDEDEAAPGVEELHAAFQINGDHEEIFLADRGGLFNGFFFSDEIEDVSIGLVGDRGPLARFLKPTPGAANQSGPAPVIASLAPLVAVPGAATQFVATGDGLDAVTAVLVGGAETAFVLGGQGELRFTAPPCTADTSVSVIAAAGEICDRALYSCRAAAEAVFVRGDANIDGVINISDAVTILGHLFSGRIVPNCHDRLDINDDGKINVADPIALLAYLFTLGTPPAPPFPNPGIDPTPDELEPCPPSGS
ncbi:MAG TPA: hypothetical protein DCM87_20475 [Planctomycetes bacterium]|nr:hypothetical protein [Planctomycetota bacterium]